jgi:hypothetical protein
MTSNLAFLALAALTFSLPATAAPRPGPVSKIAHQVGAELGVGAGEVVTAGLALSKTWNAPLVKDGKPATLDVKGFDYQLKVRDQSVVGPKVEAFASKMATQTGPQRVAHAFVEGLAEGATAAPMKEAHFEAAVEAMFARRAAAETAKQ